MAQIHKRFGDYGKSYWDRLDTFTIEYKKKKLIRIISKKVEKTYLLNSRQKRSD